MNLLKVPIRFIFPNGLRPQNGAGPGREWFVDKEKLNLINVNYQGGRWISTS